MDQQAFMVGAGYDSVQGEYFFQFLEADDPWDFWDTIFLCEDGRNWTGGSPPDLMLQEFEAFMAKARNRLTARGLNSCRVLELEEVEISKPRRHLRLIPKD